MAWSAETADPATRRTSMPTKAPKETKAAKGTKAPKEQGGGSSWIPGWRPSGRDEVPGDRLREDLPPITVLFMSSLNLVNLASLIDHAKCYELVRRHRWPEGIRCPPC